MDAKIELTAPDLTTTYPRSPRAKLGGYVLACRALDKCRADLAGSVGEYHFNCPLDGLFFDFTGIDPEAFRRRVGEGASDGEMADWIKRHAEPRERIEIIRWNNDLLGKRLCELDDQLQKFLEEYIDENLPAHRPIYVWFDVYDIEEKRI